MDIDELLKVAIESDSSDLHLKAGNYPTVRIHGRLKPLSQFPKLTPRDTYELSDQITNDYQKDKLKKDLDLDLAYSLPGFGRFRGSIYHQRGTVAIVLRIIPLEVKTIKELNLPEAIEKISLQPRGLVLVTGTTGTGKTTTLAAMIDHINAHRRENIITVEVMNPVDETAENHLKNLDRTIQWIRGYQDPFEAYVERVKDVSKKPLSNEESGLGLVRMAYEGKAILDFFVGEDNILNVSAVSDL